MSREDSTKDHVSGKILRTTRAFVTFAIYATILVALVVLVGWLLNISLLKSVFPGLATMKANTALCFAISGISLLLLRQEHPDPHRKKIASLCAFIVLVIGMLTLLEYLFHWNLGISQLFFKDYATPLLQHPGRMSHITALAFALSGMALLLISTGSPAELLIGQGISLIVAAISFLAINGYILGFRSLYRLPGFSSIALHTSLTFFILSFGIFASRPQHGMMKIFSTDLPGSRTMRMLLPAAFVIPMMLGWFVERAEAIGLLSDRTDTAMLTTFVTILFSGVIYFTARKLNRAELNILHVNRLYAMLSQVNQCIIRAKEGEKLFESICRISLDYGSFSASWIATFDDASGRLHTEAGFSRLENFDPSVDLRDSQKEEVLTPYLRSLGDGRHVICNNLKTNRLIFPSRSEAEKKGICSFASFPLIRKGKTSGVLSLYSEDKDFFNDDEVKLMEEICGDVSFALETIEHEFERKRVEEERSQLARIVEASDDAIILKSLDGTILRWNDGAQKIYGYSPLEVIGRNISLLAPPDRKQEIDDILFRLRNGEHIVHFETERLHKDGRKLWISLSISPVYDHDGRIIAASTIARDVTRRKLSEDQLQRSQNELKKSEEKYRIFFEEDLTGVFTSTPDGKLLTCNPAFLSIFGLDSVAEALKIDLNSLYRSPEIRQRFLERLIREKKLEYVDLEMVRRDGLPVYVIGNISAKFDDNAQITEITGYFFDDTKRRSLEKQLIQAQKMESLGTLAGGIAHDFNNILGVVLGHASLLKMGKANEERLGQSIQAIEKASRRGAALVRQLMTFARKTEIVFESVRINEVVGELLEVLDKTLPKYITVTTTLSPTLPSVAGERTQLYQVILNLCINARDAMPDGGTISISTNRIDGQILKLVHHDAAAHEYVQVEVKDSGMGMDEITRKRIFEPFFTTKAPGKGTGLGLAVVFGIVEAHQGFIEVESDVGKGTTFRLNFPIQAQVLENSRSKSSDAAEPAGGHETILVVEDEEMLREMTQVVLSNKGYTVVTAIDGVEAVKTYKRRQSEIAVVLTDMGLPKLSGGDLVRRLMEINSSVKIIIASGQLEPEIKAETLKAGAKAFIQKPYDPNVLLRKVREVLDQK
jgi:PAS domain S-box-containing protein